MGAPLPTGWPAPADNEVLPTVYLETATGWPLARRAVASWSVDRELVGSTLPGNVRARSGLSIGDASVTLAQTLPQQAPWMLGDNRVQTGARARLYAEHADNPAQVDLGDWLVDPASGSIGTPSISVELIEAQYAGRKLDNRLPVLGGYSGSKGNIETAWIVTTLARQIGYYAVPPRAASARASYPLQGAVHRETPEGLPEALIYGTRGWSWVRDDLTGPIGARGNDSRILFERATTDSLMPSLFDFYFDGGGLEQPGTSIYLTLNAVGTARFLFGRCFGQGAAPDNQPKSDYGQAELEVRPTEIALRDGGSNGSVSATFATGPITRGLDPNHPTRVQVEVQTLPPSSGAPASDAVGGIGRGGVRARARSSHTAAWSAWVTVVADQSDVAFQIGKTTGINTGLTSSVSGVQVTTATDPDLWTKPNADIDLLGGLITSPYLPGDVDVWSGIQQVCESTLGAAWVTRDKMLVVRSRARLAVATTAAPVIDVGTAVADLGWTLDPADVADRVTVTYLPDDRVRSSDGFNRLEVWRAENVIEVPPLATVKVPVDVAYFALGTGSGVWVGAWSDFADRQHVYSAFTNRNGTGTHSPDGALNISSRLVSAGRVEITLTNTTGLTQYTVGPTGEPVLVLRAYETAKQETSATAVRGAGETAATNPLTVDLGRHVQRQVDAQAIADFIYPRVSTPMWRATSVRVKLDWSRDIGDVVRLVHERSSLSVYALVTKVAYAGQPGEVAQTLDLVLIPDPV